MEGTFLLAIAELILKYGAPTAIAMIKEWDVEQPTLEDIKALKLKVPPPESYFDKP